MNVNIAVGLRELLIDSLSFMGRIFLAGECVLDLSPSLIIGIVVSLQQPHLSRDRAEVARVEFLVLSTKVGVSYLFRNLLFRLLEVWEGVHWDIVASCEIFSLMRGIKRRNSGVFLGV